VFLRGFWWFFRLLRGFSWFLVGFLGVGGLLLRGGDLCRFLGDIFGTGFAFGLKMNFFDRIYGIEIARPGAWQSAVLSLRGWRGGERFAWEIMHMQNQSFLLSQRFHRQLHAIKATIL